MIKKFLIKLIRMYQRAPLSTHSSCRYVPTCSEYAINALEIHGVIKGSLLTTWRILRCNPFSKGGIDNVPVKK